MEQTEKKENVKTALPLKYLINCKDEISLKWNEI